MRPLVHQVAQQFLSEIFHRHVVVVGVVGASVALPRIQFRDGVVKIALGSTATTGARATAAAAAAAAAAKDASKGRQREVGRLRTTGVRRRSVERARLGRPSAAEDRRRRLRGSFRRKQGREQPLHRAEPALSFDLRGPRRRRPQGCARPAVGVEVLARRGVHPLLPPLRQDHVGLVRPRGGGIERGGAVAAHVDYLHLLQVHFLLPAAGQRQHRHLRRGRGRRRALRERPLRDSSRHTRVKRPPRGRIHALLPPVRQQDRRERRAGRQVPLRAVGGRVDVKRVAGGGVKLRRPPRGELQRQHGLAGGPRFYGGDRLAARRGALVGCDERFCDGLLSVCDQHLQRQRRFETRHFSPFPRREGCCLR